MSRGLILALAVSGRMATTGAATAGAGRLSRFARIDEPGALSPSGLAYLAIGIVIGALLAGVFLIVSRLRRSDVKSARDPGRARAISGAVDAAARRLLWAEAWEEQLQEILTTLGEAAEVSRAYLVSLDVENGQRRIWRRNEWHAPGFTAPSGVADPVTMPLGGTGEGGWLDRLAAGLALRLKPDELSQAARGELQAQDVVSLLLVPVMVEEALWGYMGFDDFERDRRWSEAEVNALREAAAMLGTALERMRRRDELLERVADAEMLVQMAERLAVQVDQTSTLQVVCDDAARLLNAPAATVCLYESKKQRFAFAASSGPPAGFQVVTPALPRTIFGDRLLREEAPVVVDDLRDIPLSPLYAFFHGLDVRTVVVTKLAHRGQLLGLLIVSTFGATRTFTTAELTRLGRLAPLGAQAIANVDLATATKRLVRRSRDQWQQMQQIVDAVPAGLVVLNAKQRIMLANAAGRDYLSHLGNMQVGDILQKANGHALPEVPAAQGETPDRVAEVGGVKSAFTITERAIEGRNQRLGHVLVIQDKTEDERREEFVRAQERMATVGQLAAGIAHDFNNIMAIITLYSQSLERNPELAKRDQYLATISQQARQAADLIGQILNFSRRTDTKRGRLDLLPFVKEVVKLLERTLPEDIALAFKAERGPFFVEADPTQLQKVLVDLALTARDAMAQGGTLRIALSRLSLGVHDWRPVPAMTPGAWLHLQVSDSGAGIPAEEMLRLFDAPLGAREPGEASGFNLAQVYSIVKQHGGEINLTAVEGAGTTFDVYLPAATSATAEERAQSPTPILAEAAEERILLVEDHEATRLAVQDTLEMLGYQVISAETGRRALALFESHEGKVDLVLSDMVMPEMGGLELYRELMARAPEVKFLIMTGYPLEDEGKALLEAGLVDWLSKPFTPQAVAQKVRKALDGG